MSDHSIQEELIGELERLTEEQIAALLQVARVMQLSESSQVYDETSDPVIGLIEGPTDLAARAKNILREEIDSRSGWTQKDGK